MLFHSYIQCSVLIYNGLEFCLILHIWQSIFNLVPYLQVVTIEPGYYVNGKHGIRLENVVLVVDSGQAARDSTTQFLAFDALTLVPFQRRLIDVEALGPEAAAWVDAYHAVVRERLLARLALIEAEHHNMDGNALSPARRRTRDWILRETEPLCKPTN